MTDQERHENGLIVGLFYEGYVGHRNGWCLMGRYVGHKDDDANVTFWEGGDVGVIHLNGRNVREVDPTDFLKVDTPFPQMVLPDRPPPDGFSRVFVKNDQLYALDPDGTVREIMNIAPTASTLTLPPPGEDLKFVECASCAAESGTPLLCSSCIANRDVIWEAGQEIGRLRQEVETWKELRNLAIGLKPSTTPGPARFRNEAGQLVEDDDVPDEDR